MKSDELPWLIRYQILRSPITATLVGRLELMYRRRQQLAELRRGPQVRTVTVDGLLLPLDLRNLRDFLTYREIQASEGYEVGTTHVIRSMLKPGDCFVDIGANVGYFTLIGLHRVGARGRVVSVEPNPRTFERLRRTLNANDNPSNVLPINLALGDHQGTSRLYASEVEDGRDSLLHITNTWVDVSVDTLNHLLGGQIVDMVKIDAEGAEAMILRGMTQVISRNSHLKLIVEWNPPHATTTLWSQIQSAFDAYRISDEPPGRLIRIRTVSQIRHILCNLLCVSPGQVVSAWNTG